MRVAVVGAGTTGLAAAHRLATDHPGTEVVVLEAADRVGGKVLTTPFAGRQLDAAADAFLARVPDAVGLCRELGLGPALVAPATGRAYLWRHGALRPFPPGLVLGVPTDLGALAASGVVSPEGVARAGRDLVEPGPVWGADESVGSLVRRRLGDEVFEALVGPLLSGVNAGDADELSVEAGAPQLADALRHQPSLIAGLRAALAERAAATGGGPPPPVFQGLVGGTQVLTDALASAIERAGGRTHLRTPVAGVAPRSGGGYRLEVTGPGGDRGSLDVDGVVVATPAPVAADQLAGLAPGVAAGLARVAYAPVAVVALAVPAAALGQPLDGSGFLVAGGEGLVVTACSWASSKWAHLARPGDVVLRASVGRARDRAALALPDPELVAAVVADLGTTMALEGPPSEVRVTRWPDALPQLRPGHLDRVAAWRAELAADHPALAIAGAGIEGLGLPACVRQGQAAARHVAAALGLAAPN